MINQSDKLNAAIKFLDYRLDELNTSPAWQLRSGVLGELSDQLESNSFLRSSSFASASVISGNLDNTDLINPTLSYRFREDYLLTGAIAGQQIQLNMESFAFDTLVQVVNAATGQVLAFNDDANGTLNSQLTFTAQAGVDYIVRATSYSPQTTGAYTLTSNSGQLASATPIGGNQTIAGAIATTDPSDPLRPGTYYDGYLLANLVAGQQVQVNLNSTVFDAYLQVVNANTGEILVSNDNVSGTNSQLTFAVQEGIDYIVRTGTAGTGATGAYTLTTTSLTASPGFNNNYGYGLVDAAAAVASALGQSSPFPDVVNLGGSAWGLDMVNAPEVWAKGYIGQRIVVAVVDDGVDYTHLDLDANIWANSDEVASNGIDDDSNGYIDDVRGWDFGDGDNDPIPVGSHGTHVAGIIAAENNGFGVTGVAPSATIMPVKVFDAQNNGWVSNIVAGIRYAADNGADVINLSLSGTYSSEVEAAIEYATAQGAVVVMAAGNQGASEPAYPARLATNLGIAVGAVDSTKRMPAFSNDAGSTLMDYVVAPGVSILSTTPGNTYQSFNGTSMATPHVAGVAALILSANPNLTPAQVESLISGTANRTGITV